MNERPKIEETYKSGQDVINFVVYKRTDGAGDDEVLQHKLLGTTETAHVTLHPDGTVNLRVAKNKELLVNAIRTDLAGYRPSASLRVKQFIAKVKPKIANA
ncbi:MAG: hypothetical protein WBE72_15485 [Terracidiphilus sp.]